MLDKEALQKLVQSKTRISHILVQETKYSVDSSELGYSDVPVNKPTTRGGVYFSDTMAFKAKVFVSDPELSKSLSKTMLGPNTEFAKIRLIQEENPKLQILANLTNYVQKNGGFEMNLVIVETHPPNDAL